MSMTEGYNEYTCDVQTCTKHDYAQPNTEKANKYVVRKRYDNHGVVRELMVCAEHGAVYDELLETCEEGYIAFEHDGSYTLATRAEVDALQAQVDELTEAYEAMKKDRNSWMKKYNELEAEYEEYKRTHPDPINEGGEQ